MTSASFKIRDESSTSCIGSAECTVRWLFCESARHSSAAVHNKNSWRRTRIIISTVCMYRGELEASIDAIHRAIPALTEAGNAEYVAYGRGCSGYTSALKVIS